MQDYQWDAHRLVISCNGEDGLQEQGTMQGFELPDAAKPLTGPSMSLKPTSCQVRLVMVGVSCAQQACSAVSPSPPETSLIQASRLPFRWTAATGASWKKSSTNGAMVPVRPTCAPPA